MSEQLVKSSDKYKLVTSTGTVTVGLRQKGGSSIWRLTPNQCRHNIAAAERSLAIAEGHHDHISVQHWQDEIDFWQAALDAFDSENK